MTSYTNVFGGGTIFPSQATYRAITLTANLALVWPLDRYTTGEIVADIMEVQTATASLELAMPPADEASNAQPTLISNVGAVAFTVTDSEGNTIASVGAGQIWYVYITDNSTAAGSWSAFQEGSTTTNAQAAILAGAGLRANGAQLDQIMSPLSLNANYTAGPADLARLIIWTGGAGTITINAAGTNGSGWFVGIQNNGSGTLTIAATGADTIDGAASIALAPISSSTIVWAASGQYVSFANTTANAGTTFQFLSIAVAGTGNYTLSSAEQNKVGYKFTGILTGNREIIVPSTVQQYWVDNSTTGAFTLGVRTSTQASPGIAVAQNQRSILYCDGSNVVDGDTSTISVPVAVASGGTGATTANGALVNLGGTSTGIALFTTASTTAARTTLEVLSSDETMARVVGLS